MQPTLRADREQNTTDRTRLAWAAGFYLLAMAAQMSGFTSPAVALVLTAIATVFLMMPACHRAKKWHDARKETGMAALDSWYFIGGCGVVAVLLLAAAAYGLGLRNSPDAPAPPPTTGAISTIIESPTIHMGYDDKNEITSISFFGKFTKRGEKLDVFLDYTGAGHPGTVSFHLLDKVAPPRRILLTSIERFAPKQELKFSLGKVAYDTGGDTLFHIADDPKNITGLTWNNFIGSVVLIANDGKTETHKFMLVAKMRNGPGKVLVIGPDFFSSFNQW